MNRKGFDWMTTETKKLLDEMPEDTYKEIVREVLEIAKPKIEVETRQKCWENLYSKLTHVIGSESETEGWFLYPARLEELKMGN